MAVVHRPHRVYTRGAWSGQWVLSEYLYADSVTWSAAPAFSTADLVYKFGMIQRQGKTDYTEYQRKNLLGFFVKIEIDQEPTQAGNDVGTRTWYGIITEDVRGNSGAKPGGDGRIQTGVHQMTAYGLEFLLDRTHIDTSMTVDAEGQKRLVKRAIAFNNGSGDDITDKTKAVGNRSNTVQSLGAWVFQGADQTEEQLWSGDEILKYLLVHVPPRADDGSIRVPFQVGAGVEENLFFLKPLLTTEGKTLKEVLDELIDRRRMLSWYLSVDDANKVNVNVFSLAETSIPFPDGGGFLAPNQNKMTWDFDLDPQVQRATIHKSASAVYDRVTARGERRGSVFTIGSVSGTLEKDWASADELLYEDGFEATGDVYEKQNARDQWREGPQFERVYRYFRIPFDWDGKDSNNEGVAVNFTLETENGDKDVESFWRPGLRILPRLPLKEHHDYSGDKITTGTVTNTLLNGSSTASYLPILAFIQPEEGVTLSLDALGRSADSMALDGIYATGGWTAMCRPQENDAGLIISIRGKPQHAIAGDDFTPADADDESALTSFRTLDYRDILATVYVQFDSYAEATWPESPNLPADPEVLRKLIIEVPGARLDWVPWGTFVGVTADNQPETSSGGWLNDDRPRLKNIARFAYQWYSRQRQALDVSYHRLNLPAGMDVGAMITKIGSGNTEESVLSVVTAISQDLLGGVTNVKTQYANLDMRRLG